MKRYMPRCSRFAAGKDECVDAFEIGCAANVARLCPERLEFVNVLAEVALKSENADERKICRLCRHCEEKCEATAEHFDEAIPYHWRKDCFLESSSLRSLDSPRNDEGNNIGVLDCLNE